MTRQHKASCIQMMHIGGLHKTEIKTPVQWEKFKGAAAGRRHRRDEALVVK